ncbi:monovalent cation:proton antiporter-2 (CPA2) family protein [Gilvimarinus sp. SDUM040013]|uniref:Monovalent cation:proton antiporter-2 (CPA2) family protein n=1 Tax=Gilvimarinus gilvus TaxID=3058038 RepID=A0ABU4S5I1_9GAMM|nr:monovalent cation:proton antiporter-2 (CPA2) family protein [Gilvimarinus sp. SDUM040013]MDO3385870.1 monovalent cation:proton antiporter-2 (CPA2) family protein [Gilvimarinus sp. SDUM040013]MDX6851163.1 monovalent cation:proton antiporter-2 (CPA2) family protein [Gilvimarinus sp. SDUM040013]
MLVNILIYLFAAIVAVPIAKRLGLGAVLGYLLAGVLIGPYVFSLVGDQTDVMHVAEFGVVMMLFLIGLELQPARLWDLRKPILGLGGLQVMLTASLITGLVVALFDLSWQSALAIGLALALSSTAIVIQSLEERGLLNTPAGSNAFSVLLFQDVAIIPILALLPLLSSATNTVSEQHASAIDHLPVVIQVGVSVMTIALVILAGRFLAAPIFRLIAKSNSREIFTAFALFIVVAITVLMQFIGLSPALGAFIAGVVLADCEYRHEIEVDIEPFKGLLLGLFFITVGAGIDFYLLLDKPLLVTLCVAMLVAVKLAVLLLLAAVFKMGRWRGLLFSLALAQGGEFAFVIVAAAQSAKVFDTDVGSVVILTVALSMLVTPLLLALYETLFSRTGRSTSTPEADADIASTDHVIIAGYGRFGQIVGRLLSAQGYRLTILDHSPGQVELVRRFGNKIYYGDASRSDLLRAAGGAEARLLVVAVDEPERAMRIIETARKHFPNLKILVRAVDRRHAYQLLDAGVDGFRRETFHSALALGVDALKQLGQASDAAERAGELFERHDDKSLRKLAKVWGDDKTYGKAIRKNLDDLRRVLQEDKGTEQAGDDTR